VLRRARYLAACLAAVTAIVACADNGTDVPDGAEAGLVVEYDTFDGDTATLADYRGRPLVVNFWASWCAPCVTEMPDIEAVHQASGDRVAFVGLSTDFRRSDATAMADKTGVTYDLGYDPDEQIVRRFLTVGLPVTVFVRADGTIATVHSGPLSEDELRDLVRDELEVEL
jgi:thiol-disulfide isomerase/thioredoxin